MKHVFKTRIIALVMIIVVMLGIVGNQNMALADNTFKVNGKNFPSGEFPVNGSNPYCSCGADVGSGFHWCCWAFSSAAYKYIWGVTFNRTKDNLIRNIPASDRRLTPDNLKKYLSQAKPGANVRIGNEANWTDPDNNGHSLIFLGFSNNSKTAAYFAEGNYDGKGHTRIYNWSFDALCSSYSYYAYVKYVIFPGAPEWSEPIVPEVIKTGTYWIKLKNSSIYVGSEGKASKGQYIRLTSFPTVWTIDGMPDSYAIYIAEDKMYLNGWTENTVSEGTDLRFYRDTSHDSQRFLVLLDPSGKYYKIASKQNPHLVMTLSGDGTFSFRKDENKDTQFFEFVTPKIADVVIPTDDIASGDYYIAYKDMYVSPEKTVCANGIDYIVTKQFSIHSATVFSISGKAGDKSRQIKDADENAVINTWTVEIVTPGCRVTTYTVTNHSSQRWRFCKVTGGYAILSAQNNSLCIGVNSNNKLVIETFTGAENQVFQFVKATGSGVGSEEIEPTPTSTPVPTKAPTPTNTPVPTKAATPTNTPVPTKAATPTSTPKPTKTPTPTNTPVPTKAATPTSTPKPTKAPTPTNTPVPTKAATPTSTPKPTKAPKPTNTPVPTKAATPTSTPKPTKALTPTNTPVPTKAATPTSTPNPTKAPKPTNTPVPPKASTEVPPIDIVAEEVIPDTADETVTSDPAEEMVNEMPVKAEETAKAGMVAEVETAAKAEDDKSSSADAMTTSGTASKIEATDPSAGTTNTTDIWAFNDSRHDQTDILAEKVADLLKDNNDKTDTAESSAGKLFTTEQLIIVILAVFVLVFACSLLSNARERSNRKS